jgi:hypothetical protein
MSQLTIQDLNYCQIEDLNDLEGGSVSVANSVGVGVNVKPSVDVNVDVKKQLIDTNVFTPVQVAVAVGTGVALDGRAVANTSVSNVLQRS